MNESIKYMAEVSKAAAEGAVIEIRNRDSSEWHTVDSLNCYHLWNWVKFDHRVKQQPAPPRKLIGLQSDRQPLLSAHVTHHAALCDFLPTEDEQVQKVEFIELTPEIKAKLGI